MQTFRAVPERGRNLEAVPMTIYAPDGDIELRRVDSDAPRPAGAILRDFEARDLS